MLSEHGYITDDGVGMSVFLPLQLNKPLLIAGPAGVGKTEIAKVMARAMQTDLIRMQCYEGLDATHALYEWNYQRQLLHLKMVEHTGQTVDEKEKVIFSQEFLMKRPLLQAITHHRKPVLLIDEVDRSDEEFESFLLEVLSDWQITIPETGTIKATHIPQVILTGNRTRELSEALRRRCLYLYIDYPDFEKKWMIVKSKVSDIDRKLGEEICRFMQTLRNVKLEKSPGIAETLDWAMALSPLHIDYLDKTIIEQTLGVIIKDWRDSRQVQMSLSELLEKQGCSPGLITDDYPPNFPFQNIVQFCRFLRHKGFALSAEEEVMASEALQFIDCSKRKLFSLALKTILCRSWKELQELDGLFNEY